MSITREQIDSVYNGLLDLCLCKGCLFRDFIEAYHKNVIEFIDDKERKIKRLEAENENLQNFRFVQVGELPDLTEKAKEFVEKMALQGIGLEMPISEKGGAE